MVKNSDIAAWLEPQELALNENAHAIRLCQNRLLKALGRLDRLVPPETLAHIERLQEEVKNFDVRISLIGQVKAGKTALTNAMIGRPELLPSDVNPWTSVITSIHMNTAQPMGKNAIFTFFTTEEWNNMVNIGGHLGEMAARADYQEELEELRNQVQTMQRRTKARLGRNFNMLLDGYHSFLGFSPDMIKKYVCLGEDDETKEGRYADVTRSADIYIENNDYVLPTVICDTPGVNDPFLLREAVTLDNLSDTNICVVVLSAHQAFTAVDVGLLRILAALKHEQLVIFVNRIDELQDPDTQIPEIDDYIRRLLKEQNLADDMPIVFGSAAWAEIESAGIADTVDNPTIDALSQFAQAREARKGATSSTESAPNFGSSENAREKMADLSGLYELRSILQHRSAVNVARPFLDDVRNQALDLSHQALLYLQEASASKSSLRTDLDFSAFFDEIDTILSEADEDLLDVAKELSDQVLFMMSGAFRSFLQRGKASLKQHLDAKKPVNEWQADSDSLRRDLNMAHDEFVALAPARVNKVMAKTAARLEKIYEMVLDDNAQLYSVRPPLSDTPKTPASLMRTMAIDMNTGWFSSWFRSHFDQESYLKKFEDITTAEMRTTLTEMQTVYVTAFIKKIRAQLHDFLEGHLRTLQSLSAIGEDTQRTEVLQKLGVDTEIRHRLAELESVVADLEKVFQKPRPDELSQLSSVA